MRRLPPMLLAVAMLSVIALAVALPAPASAGDADRAARFEAKGKKAYVKKRWTDAIAAFDAAYRADAKPKYLFNIAKAYEQKGDLDKAIEYCERYVSEAEDEDDKTDGQDLLTMLRIKQEHEGEEKEGEVQAAVAKPAPKPEPQAKPAPPPPEAEPPPKKPALGKAAPADMVRAAKEREVPPPQEIEGEGGGIPQGPMYLYVGAAALFAGGMLVGLMARAAQDDRDALQGTETPIQLSEIDGHDATARDRAKTANALYVLSVLAAGAGGLWHMQTDTSASATLTPALGGAVLTVSLP